MCPLYSSGRMPMYVAPIKISAMLTVIISSSSENPRCFLNLIRLFHGGDSDEVEAVFSCSATNRSRSMPRKQRALANGKAFPRDHLTVIIVRESFGEGKTRTSNSGLDVRHTTFGPLIALFRIGSLPKSVHLFPCDNHQK